MLARVLLRLFGLAASLLAASALIFAALELLPGNVAQLMLGTEASPEAVAALAEQLGLQRPLWQRYLQWLQGLLSAELGDSYAYGAPVAQLIAERLSVSLPLTALALLLALALALACGCYAAARQGRAGERWVLLLSQLGLALPGFWLGILLMLLFALKLQWLPAGGFPGWGSEGADSGFAFWPALQALLLPAVALALVQAAQLTRLLRAALLEVLGEDYIRSARAKGLSPRVVLMRHALRNALIPVLTLLGLQAAQLVAGAVVIEQLFQLPGLGQLIFQAIANRDLIVLRNALMLLVALVLLINFIVDALQTLIDPRLRRELPR
ncbi:ABC transporter permease [Paucibacter sp. APW11]|uniref:ABC transporter permease n=1 Tax=Roseateles aquae TaxID=3077235 RepID=A0ABU3PGS3_9BURK|nr:ABC transporter permease [Paucibacter sp. APW11]MDT9001764.1 ABC transporter permease [Paucibacter sp. APW11]